ncbi:tetratricopeptide repeat protein, partial [Methylobacterium sp. UNCCL110]
LTAAGDGTVSPEAKALFEKAQAKEPNAPKPRFYLARAAEQAGDTGEAIRQLTELEASSPPTAPWLGIVKQSLARLKGEPPPPPTTPQAAPKIPAEQQAAIRGMVDGLDARLKAGGGTSDEWLRLVRSRVVLGEPDQAAAALARARTALAGDPQGLAQVEQGARAVGLGAEGAAPGPAGSGEAGPTAQAEKEAAMAAVRAMPQAEQQAAIRSMVEGLDRRLAARGGTPDEWMRLVRSYSALGERDQAVKALDRARMALAANSDAVARLDGLARELDLAAKPNP